MSIESTFKKPMSIFSIFFDILLMYVDSINIKKSMLILVVILNIEVD